jgi:DNA-dependent RNA polymerase auxiliary subunit epsilon
MDTSVGKYFDRMTEILKKKGLLLKDMLYLSELQTSAIQSEELDTLRKLVDKKQLKIEAIDKLDDEFDIYFERLKAVTNVKKLDELNVSEFPGAKALKDATAEILAIAEKIRETENVNSQKCAELKKKLGEQISKAKQSKKLDDAYNQKFNNTPSYYFDKKK